jgi:adenosylcobinamide-phosphate synthase
VSGRAVGIAAGAVLDAAIGDPRRGHPVAGFGRVAAGLERRVWAPRRAAGAAYAGALVAGAALGAGLAERLAPRRATLALVLWTTLGGRSLAREGLRLAALVERGDLEGARRRLPALAGRDPRGLGGAELCRAAIESVAENTADAVVGPLFWCAVAGAPGAAGYRAANTLDAMVGHRTPRHERFGWAAARLDDVATWPAARIGALLACALAPVAGGDPARALAILRRDGAEHPSPNAGRLEAAFAGALGVRLGGPLSYGGREEDRPVLGAEGRAPGPADLRRAVRLSLAVGAAAAAMAAASAR